MQKNLAQNSIADCVQLAVRRGIKTKPCNQNQLVEFFSRVHFEERYNVYIYFVMSYPLAKRESLYVLPVRATKICKLLYLIFIGSM